MSEIAISFRNTKGIVKPLNAVNNGPILATVRGIGTDKAFAELQIPYARLHDSAFFSKYGGEYTVDVHRIFRNFDADENDEKNYLFEATDNYLKDINQVGTKIFYRLGASIEHYIKCGTYPPKDFLKWARICEHIIRHYNEGWANGFQYGIEYWEIWNEPDCKNADGSNPCWQGNEEQFIEFYSVVAKYLKGCFPNIKIGGPAFCNIWHDEFVKKFLERVKEDDIPMDFFSYHWYGNRVSYLKETIGKASYLLNSYGLGDREKILNEWNYVEGWLGDEFVSSIKAIKGQVGAAFVCAAMCESQKLDIDMMMYYDARPCAFCGLFDSDLYQNLKTYNAFAYFNELSQCKNAIDVKVNDTNDLYACAAKSERKACFVLTRFSNEKTLDVERINLSFGDIPQEYKRAQIFISDENRDNVLIKEIVIDGSKVEFFLELKNYDMIFLKFTN